MAPVPYRGSDNEPSYVPIIANEISVLKDVSISEISMVTTGNAESLFDFSLN